MEIRPDRKLYSLKESYWITYNAIRSIPAIRNAIKKEGMSRQFSERILLAVTEVNGCLICSYAHSRMALETGMSNEEIQNLLAGTFDDVPQEEMAAVLFGQHYAESRGHPTKEAYDRIVELYGISMALGILGASRVMMWGNAYGIPYSSFVNRFKGKPDERCNLVYEVSMLLSTIFYLPISFIHALLSALFRVPIMI
jgi:AhpD family alkylhydroperoxidase